MIQKFVNGMILLKIKKPYNRKIASNINKVSNKQRKKLKILMNKQKKRDLKSIIFKNYSKNLNRNMKNKNNISLNDKLLI